MDNFAKMEELTNLNIKLAFLLTASVLLIVISSFNFISADVLSVNSGGSSEVVVNPDSYIEGFFSTAYIPACGNGILDAGEACDNGGSNGACPATCSASCTSNSCGVTPGGGGPGGGGPSGPSQNLSISPTQFTINLAVNTNQRQTITVTNLGSSATTISVSQSNLTNMIILDTTSFNLSAGASKVIGVTFVALNETGIFTGKIFVGGYEIPVSINVKTKLLLFDSNIIVLNKDYKVPKGDQLLTQVTLIPLGDQERLDVTLDYSIRDYSGKIYLTKKETLLVDKRIAFNRNFDTGSLPLGKYIVGLVLTYPGGVAPSSAYFEVTNPAPITFGTIVLWLLVLIILIGIAILLIILYRRRKKKEESE